MRIKLNHIVQAVAPKHNIEAMTLSEMWKNKNESKKVSKNCNEFD
jgi:hypothetical protein